MTSLHIDIVGMTCDHCVRAVRNRLTETPGVKVTDVKVGSADFSFDPAQVSLDEIQDLISDEGYTVDTITEPAR